MPIWLTSLVFAVLVVTIPFTLILRIMLQLPKVLASSHRRWPMSLNIALIGVITAYVTIFIRSAYYGRSANPPAVFMEFVIAALAYIFGLVLIQRQYCGIYPEYIITTGTTGLSLRKVAYRNITGVDEVSQARGESVLRITTTYDATVSFTLPTRYVSIFYERLKALEKQRFMD